MRRLADAVDNSDKVTMSARLIASTADRGILVSFPVRARKSAALDSQHVSLLPAFVSDQLYLKSCTKMQNCYMCITIVLLE